MIGSKLCALYSAVVDEEKCLAAELPGGATIAVIKNQSASSSDRGAPRAWLVVLPHDCGLKVEGATGVAFRDAGAEGNA